MHACECVYMCTYKRTYVRVYLQRSNDVRARSPSKSAARRGCAGNMGRDSQGARGLRVNVRTGSRPPHRVIERLSDRYGGLQAIATREKMQIRMVLSTDHLPVKRSC
jgi:hypothetical protein